MVLLGEIKSVSSVPVTFGTPTDPSQTFGSAFKVTVQLGVKLMRLRDSSILWQNEDFLFSERYILNENVRDFFSEENPALERLAQNFAASLASSISIGQRLDISNPGSTGKRTGQRSVPTCYLILGQEQYLCRQAIDLLKNKALPSDALAFDYSEFIGGEIPVDEILGVCQHLSDDLQTQGCAGEWSG